MSYLEVVAGIIVCNDKILCVQRPKSKFDYLSYKFEFPGGKVEVGEILSTAVKREIKEELNLDLGSIIPFISISHSYPDFDILLHTFICQIEIEFANFELKEHYSARWESKGDLVGLDWAAADIPIVERLVNTNL